MPNDIDTLKPSKMKVGKIYRHKVAPHIALALNPIQTQRSLWLVVQFAFLGKTVEGILFDQGFFDECKETGAKAGERVRRTNGIGLYHLPVTQEVVSDFHGGYASCGSWLVSFS
ncbi:MAG: hypothetical protein ACE5JX_20205 [Acidobacteriota bacterium]